MMFLFNKKKTENTIDGLEKNRGIGTGGYNENGFDHIVSLGYNCEVSFRIRDYLEREIDSYPLSWAYICDQSKMSDIIDHLDDMFTGDTEVRLKSGMIWCEKLNVSFHTKISHENLCETNKKEYRQEALAEMNQRYAYLRKKFNDLFQSADSSLFVMKCQEFQEHETIVHYLRDLEKKLSEKYISQKFFLLTVTDDIGLYKMLRKESNNVRGCALISQFADDGSTEQGGDIEGWIEIINYYNHVKDVAYDNMNYMASTVGRKKGKNVLENKYLELKEWCDDLQKAKDWLEEQYKWQAEKIKKLETD